MTTPFLIVGITFLSTLCGGFLGIRYRERLHTIISFTAGILLGVVFFELLPEIFELTSAAGRSVQPAMIALVLGFLAIHILEKVVTIHTAHEGEYAKHHHPVVGITSALGIAVHSFFDGVGIGLGFQSNPQVGSMIALAVIAHAFSDGLNTVSLMLLHKNTVRRAWIFLAINAIAPVLGVLATTAIMVPDGALVLYLSYFAGFLLYLSAGDLLPEAHSMHSSFTVIALTVLGIVCIGLITQIA